MGRTTKVGAILASILALLLSVAVIVFLILGMCGVFGLDSPTANQYRVTFVANNMVLSDHTYLRGEDIITDDIVVPSKPDDEYGLDYYFVGWDTNGNNIPNPVPTKAYSNINAVAIYRASSYPEVSEIEESYGPIIDLTGGSSYES